MTLRHTMKWAAATAITAPFLAAGLITPATTPADLGQLLGQGLAGGVELMTMISCGICVGAGASLLFSGSGAVIAFLSTSMSIAKMGACVGACGAVVGL
jgi:hypothetical protein